MKQVFALLFLIPLLAGCAEPAPPTPSGASFDGDATLALVEDIVYLSDGSLRARTPQLAGHLDTAKWLETQMLTGTDGRWKTTMDIFSGSEYDALDKGSVDLYTKGSYCSDEDRGDLADLHFRNIYATLPGADPDGGHVVLGAHWDAKEDAHDGNGPIPAANDGASGVAVLLQLQRHIVDHDLSFPFDLTVAFFDGEDGFEDCHPLAGSLWSARHHNDMGWPLEGMTQFLLLDMVGDPDARFIRESQSVASDAALVDALWAHAATTDLADNFVDTRRSVVDDHVPFIEEGFQAVDLIDAGHPNYFQPYWHTMEDTPDKLSAAMLGDVGDLLVWMLTDPPTQTLLQD